MFINNVKNTNTFVKFVMYRNANKKRCKMKNIQFLLLLSVICYSTQAAQYRNKTFRFRIEIPDNYKVEYQENKNYCLEATAEDGSKFYIYAAYAGEEKKFIPTNVDSSDTRYFTLKNPASEKGSVFSNRRTRTYELANGWNATSITVYARDYMYILVGVYDKDAVPINQMISTFSTAHEGCYQNFFSSLYGRIASDTWCKVWFFITTWTISLIALIAMIVIIAGLSESIVLCILFAPIAVLGYLYVVFHDQLINLLWSNISFWKFVTDILSAFAD